MAHSEEGGSMGSSSAEEEELLPAGAGELRAQRGKHQRRHFASTSFGVACVVCCGVLAALRGVPSLSSVRADSSPLTVRSLLEGRELTELATDNLMSIGKDAFVPVSRDEVRAHVADNFRNISHKIRELYPEAHQQMETLQLSEAQKESVLRVLRHYGDARMLRVTNDITDAVRETMLARGDHESLKRRLSEKLQPRLGEMRQLAEDMFPGSGAHFAFDVEQLPVVHQFAKWHPRLEVDFGALTAPNAATSRRLTGIEDVDGGVRAQAQTLFQSLEHTLGDKMPTAPARMLSFFDDTSDAESSSSSTSQGSPTSKGGEQSFMECVMKAVPNPMSVMSCIAKNISAVMKMMMNFVKGGR